MYSSRVTTLLIVTFWSSAVSDAFDFNEVRIAYADQVCIIPDFFGVPTFDQGQPVDGALPFCRQFFEAGQKAFPEVFVQWPIDSF